MHRLLERGVLEQQQARLASITLPAGATCIGKSLRELALPELGVHVVSLRLSSGRVIDAGDSQRLAGGDTLVLSGVPEALSMAEETLTKG